MHAKIKNPQKTFFTKKNQFQNSKHYQKLWVIFLPFFHSISFFRTKNFLFANNGRNFYPETPFLLLNRF